MKLLTDSCFDFGGVIEVFGGERIEERERSVLGPSGDGKGRLAGQLARG